MIEPATVRRRKVAEVVRRLQEASLSRPKFDAPVPEGRKAVRLARGPAAEPIVAFPAPLALCGPQQYAKFAPRFRGVRDLHVLTMPGFVGREALPADLDVAVEDQLRAIERASGASPPVLAGYSTGGTFAFGMAAQLEQRGLPVAAVVLLDAYPTRDDTPLTGQIEALALKLFEDPEFRVYLNDTRLSAMGWYTRVVLDWPLEPVAAPALLVRSEEPMQGVSRDDDWQATWPFRHDVVEVPGDHYEMIDEKADTTADAIETWLSATLPAR
jgi:thioesterase domain-containing protein